VAQVVRGAPGPDGVDQELRVVLTVAGGRAHLELDPEGRVAGTATIVLAYPDALAWRRASSTRPTHWPPGGCGCAGDLAALVAGQDVLAGAAGQLGTELTS